MQYLLTNIKKLYQVREQGITCVKGKDMAELPIIENAYLLIEDGKIKQFGNMDSIKSVPEESIRKIFNLKAEITDCNNRIVLPAYCDSHTHLVFAATREGEFVDKIKGLSYEEIAAKGGGILNSAKKLSETSELELLESAVLRLREIAKQGTGAVEIKSGYGLSVEGELKMLRVIKRLRKLSPVTIKATFLGAHTIPVEYKTKRAEYINLVINEMIPKVAAEGLADYCDVFCEKGFFTPEETDSILQAGIKHGLKPKLHANQLAVSGGVQVGIRNKAISVDHLESIGEEEITALKNSTTVPTLLPSAAFFLQMNYPPARKLIEAGLPVTLASDYNPGSSPSGRMGFVLSLACIQMKMTPEEAINAATLNGAHAMELDSELGSINVGKKANLLIFQPGVTLANIPYFFGKDCIEKVLINGVVQ